MKSGFLTGFSCFWAMFKNINIYELSNNICVKILPWSVI